LDLVDQLEIFGSGYELGIFGLLIQKLQLELEESLRVLQKDGSWLETRHGYSDFGPFLDEVQALHL
jgi:hypothetical protein